MELAVSTMAMREKPDFTGNLGEDLVLLARYFRVEIEPYDGVGKSLFNHFSLGVNDGTEMRVSLPESAEVDGTPAFADYRIDSLADELAQVEQRYRVLQASGIETITPQVLRELDDELLAACKKAGNSDIEPSSNLGLHLRFLGETGHPRWSLFIQNDVIRRLVCSAEAEELSYQLFTRRTPESDVPTAVYLSRIDPFMPLAVVVPRAVLQMRAQCLDPDVIVFARRGLVVRGFSPHDIWKSYATIAQKINDVSQARRSELTWIFHGAGGLLDEKLFEPAKEALAECLGAERQLVVWESSREGILRKAICLSEVLETIGQGYPENCMAALGGVLPLVVMLQEGDGDGEVKNRIRQAWEEYTKRCGQERPLRFDDSRHVPSVIVLAGLGVITAGRNPDESKNAYAALSEALLVMEETRVFGGIQQLSYPEQVCAVNAPVDRWRHA